MKQWQVFTTDTTYIVGAEKVGRTDDTYTFLDAEGKVVALFEAQHVIGVMECEDGPTPPPPRLRRRNRPYPGK